MRVDTPTVLKLRDRLLAARPSDAGDDAAGTPSPNQQAAREVVSPVAEVLFLTMSADGEFASSETRAVRNAIEALTDDVLPGTVVDDMMREFAERLEREGLEARVEAISSRFALDRTGAEAAFRLAAAIASSDGQVDAAEQALIEELRQYFGISARRAGALLGSDTAG